MPTGPAGVFDSLQANVPFLYPLKWSENKFSRGIDMKHRPKLSYS